MSEAVGSLKALRATDTAVYAAIRAEEQRQREKLLLIASENFRQSGGLGGARQRHD